MNSLNYQNVAGTALSLFESSHTLFWELLPVAFLLSIVGMYVSGEITGGRLEGLLRRTLVAIMLLTAFPQISGTVQALGEHLTTAFGGEQTILQIFSQVATRAKEIKDAGSFSWWKIGDMGLTIIATISFLVLSVIQHFLAVLHLVTWNLLNILGPLALLGCLFPSWSNVPRGIFVGMLELSLWKPVWVILSRILIAIGFGETPADPSQWFDTAVMNFAVAGLMASTPALVHGFLSGTLGSVGGSTMQSMTSGLGAALSQTPMRFIQSKASSLKDNTVGRGMRAASKAIPSWAGAKKFPKINSPKPKGRS